MAFIKNLKIKAGEENIIKVPEITCLSIVTDRLPFSNTERLVIEAVNGNWTFSLNDVSYLELDIVAENRIVHVFSRAEAKDAEIQ